MDKLTHIDLFSGIGGFALAARWAGIETVQFVEIDPFCQKVLRKNFPGVPIHDDIKTFAYAEAVYVERCKNGQGEKQLGRSDKRYFQNIERPFLLTGGFPCQPFSCAGKRRGKEDDRFLWPEMLRVVSEAKPRWVIGENVAGFINMGLDDCISDLENQGYEVQAFVIPACAVNAPHRRDRVWIVAFKSDLCRFNDSLSVTEGIRRRVDATVKRTDCHAADTDRFNGNDAGHDAGEVSQFQKAEIFRGESNTDTGNARLSGCERPGSHEQRQAAHGSTAECFSAWNEPWLEVATRLCSLDVRLPGGLVRPKGWRVNALKAVGNSVVPQIPYLIMKGILEVEKELATFNKP